MSTQPESVVTSESKMLPNARQIRRFWSFVEKTDDCWLWVGALKPTGYGLRSFSRDGRHFTWLVHRLAYELEVGPIPDGMCVCHTCDVPNCVNPEHLWLGSHDDNMSDRQGKSRQTHGEGHPQAKLCDEIVRSIRIRRKNGESAHSLASEFGISPGVIYDIHEGKTWKHVIG